MALMVSTRLAYQATSYLLCLSVPDSQVIQKHSAAATSSVVAAWSGLTTQMFQLPAPSSAPHITLSTQSRPPVLVLRGFVGTAVIFGTTGDHIADRVGIYTNPCVVCLSALVPSECVAPASLQSADFFIGPSADATGFLTNNGGFVAHQDLLRRLASALGI